MPQDDTIEGLGPLRPVNTGAGPTSDLRTKSFACPQDPNLYPTHPSQMLKLYHNSETARFDHRAIDARHEACVVSRLGNKWPNSSEVSPRVVARIIAEAEAAGRRIPCQMGDVFNRVYISDTYIDACGNYYRGVKYVEYLSLDEHMGTLWSPGRHTADKGPTRQDGQVVQGTYAVPHTDFFLLAELLPGDMAGIERERAAARSTHTLDAAGRIFHLNR
jgi:hypothetical protein